MSITHRVRRTLGVAMAGAMVLSLMPAAAAFADFDDVCEGAPDNDFDDADSISETQEPFVDCMAAYGITVGDTDGDFNPGESTSRQHMALFLARTLSQAEDGDLTIPEDEDDEFSDISGISPEEARHAINWLEERGLIEGYEDGTYRPAVDVRRDQMASFIVRLMVELGVTMPVVTEDHFDDDDGTFHEDNINILAELGIVQGFTDGTYRPGEDVTRQQMAAYIIGAVIEIDEAGNWNGVFVEPEGESNQTFPIGDGTAAENEVEESRQYSISGLDDDTSYDLALFDAGDVSVDDDGVVTFEDDDDNNQADWTPNASAATGAIIEVVNGSTNDSTDNHVEASPVNGTISFTITSDVADSVVPVIWVDEDVADDDSLDVDDDGEPTEEFGIGGQKTWIPAEAATGQIDATGDVLLEDEDIASVDKDANRIITNDRTYFYDSNDTFYVSSTDSTDLLDNTECGNAAFQVTMAGFEAELSAGDQLDNSTFYQANEELPSTFCLEDVAPAAPGAAFEEADDTSITYTVTGLATGATANVYCGPDNDNAFNRSTDVLRGSSATDQDADTAGFQLIASGLTQTTDYDCFVTQTVDGEESGPSGRQDDSTTAPPDPPIITDAQITTDAPIEGRVGVGDEWRLIFDEEMDTAVAGATINLTDPDGDTIRVVCENADGTIIVDPDDDDFLTEAACEVVDGPDADGVFETLELTLLTNAEDRNAAGDAGTDGGGIQYPLTINSATGLTDTNGENVDVSSSTDTTVDEE